MKICISNSISIDVKQLNDKYKLLDNLKKHFRIKSPEYEKSDNKKAFKESEKYIQLYGMTKSKITFPRGVCDELLEMLSNEVGADEIEIVDKRLLLEDIDFPKPQFEMYKHQKKIVKKGYALSQGTFQAGCGSGKTIALINLIVKCRQPALVIVPNDNSLLKQWVKNVEDVLGIKYKDRNDYIGIIGDGYYDYKNKYITIAMNQSIYNHKDDKELFKSFGFVCMDECFYKDTLITMSDLTKKKISEIKVGDKITNSNGTDIIEKVIVNKVPLERLAIVTLSNGNQILTTLEHEFYCNNTWKKCCEMKVGDTLYGYKDMLNVWQRIRKTWRHIHSMRSLQICRSAMQLLWKNVSNNFERLQKRTWNNLLFSRMFCKEFYWSKTHFGSKTKNVKILQTMETNKARKNARKKEFNSYEEKQSNDVSRKYRQDDANKNEEWNFRLAWFKRWKRRIYRPTMETMCGFNPCDKNRSSFRVCNRFGEKARWLSNKLQSRFSLSQSKTCNRSRWGISQLRMGQSKRLKEKRKVGNIRVESITFYKQGDRREYFERYISDKERTCGYIEMYDLTVKEQHNYIANDVLVHNCHMVGARTFRSSIHLFPAYYRFGATATLFRNDNLSSFIEDYCGKCFCVITDEELEQSKLLITPKMYKRTTNFKFKINYKYQNWYNTMIKYLMLNKARNNQIVSDIVKNSIDKDRIALIVSTRVNHCVELAKLIAKKKPKVRMGILVGENVYYDNLVTYDVETKAKNGELDIIFGVDKVKQGLDIPPIEDVYIVAPRKSQVDVTQIVGRAMRPSDCFGKYKNKSDKQPAIYDYVDCYIDVLANQYKEWRLPVYEDRCEIVKSKRLERKSSHGKRKRK